MFKKTKWFLIVLLSLTLIGCSSGEDQSAEESTADTSEPSEGATSEEVATNGLSETPESKDSSKVIPDNTEDKMMVYEAHIELETEDYDQFYQSLQEKMNETEAYIVETNIHKTEQGNREGHIRLRVPQNHFETLLTGFEDISDTIQSRNVSGRDVTKEYVDLESRLEAKNKVESRLLTFLEQAEKTEDLIKISQDLERVQAEIETLKGQMNYLENQSDFSTITVSLTETKVVVPKVDSQELNTWEKTKQAFFSSVNGLVSFFSWLFIFIIGYSPVIVLFAAIALLGWLWIRSRKKRADEN
ncbi:DUF4349 domain-containing protein [Halobacillus mangrovi]|uniref:DUF4349 domain-containing protein n=1 Tax=Halobacillus mangrovi TaxID=402384 RepID=A0A1W5ZXI8_9BACI|nr:DUF4349 domain-containing protein [Halobacillus mangrovi]ARI78055.1 hypothetical protein HM131_14875 [Halobacillus mangrovi]